MHKDETAPCPRLRIGVSGCLTGAPVRFDGGHKRSSIPHDVLDELFELVPVCPEVEIGLGTPRNPIRLIGDSHSPRAVDARGSGLDVTQALHDLGVRRARLDDGLDGYVFMKDSPSCGLYRVRVYSRTPGEQEGPPSRSGRGIYADAFCRERPTLPVEESGRLFDAALLENFATRAYVHSKFRKLRDGGVTAAALVQFHSRHKYLVMAHSVEGYRNLGRLISNLSGDLDVLTRKYFVELMSVLSRPATRGGHANVLAHLQGYVKRHLSSDARTELARAIDSYRLGEIPLLAPMTLLKHHLSTWRAEYALSQVYLDPHPAFAGLRRAL